MKFYLILFIIALINPVFAEAFESSLKSTTVVIPGGEGGIGFDDLNYSSELHKVLVPAVRQKGQKIGISSVDEGNGVLFVGDHGRTELDALDAKSGSVIATADLAEDFDFLRYDPSHQEVWVTEPDKKQIEIIKFTPGDHPRLVAKMIISLHDEPESIVIDQTRHRAYTNLGPKAIAIDLESHTVVDSWSNECTKSRGDALDEQKGWLFIACGEGKAEVFDLNNENKEISNLITDPGVDVISYNQKLSHVYFTSGKNATLSVIGVSAQGKLSLLGQASADKRSHCVVGDDQKNIWVCDPLKGQLLRYKDNL